MRGMMKELWSFFFSPNRLIEEVLLELPPPKYVTWHFDLIGKSFSHSPLGKSSDLFVELPDLARTMHCIKNRFCYCYFMQRHFYRLISWNNNLSY